MAEPSSDTTGSDDADKRSDGGLTRAPRWVKMLALVALVLIMLFVVVQIAGIGGGHGPGRHIPRSDVEHGAQRS